MANNPNERESYHEVPAKNYLFLLNIAIHKRFFLWWTTILWVSCYTLTRFFGLDYLILAWHIQNWWIAFPYAAVIGGSLLIWQHEVKRNAEKEMREAVRLQKIHKAYIDSQPHMQDSPPFNPAEVNKKH